MKGNSFFSMVVVVLGIRGAEFTDQPVPSAPVPEPTTVAIIGIGLA